jgi:hypothetical protein
MRFGLALLLISCAAKQTGGFVDGINPEVMRRHLSYIASDELEGRMSGERGNDKVTEYIASVYRDASLKPIGDHGSYFQHFMAGRRKPVKTRNTIGLLEGTDLKDQYIVIGAHHDHVGRKGMRDVGQIGDVVGGDDIWNGADDNGSGTCCLVTLVQAAKGWKPRRSIVFMTWSAEEWGLLGSKHYCDDPIVPLSKTVAYFNMDMMGRGTLANSTPASGFLTAIGKFYEPIVQRAAARTGLKMNLGDHYGPGSDHVSFAGKRVPVLSFHENGPCPDYHRVTDHADKINYAYMSALASTVYWVLREAADTPEAPRWNPEYKTPAPPKEEKPRLGVGAESLSREELAELGLKDQGAVVIVAVMEGSVAGQFGMKEDDVIVKIAGKPLPVDGAREALRPILDSLERGVEYEIEYIRGKERRTVKITWPKL